MKKFQNKLDKVKPKFVSNEVKSDNFLKEEKVAEPVKEEKVVEPVKEEKVVEPVKEPEEVYVGPRCGFCKSEMELIKDSTNEKGYKCLDCGRGLTVCIEKKN